MWLGWLESYWQLHRDSCICHRDHVDPAHPLHTAVGREEDLMLSAGELDLAELLKNVNMNSEAGVLVICSGVLW